MKDKYAPLQLRISRLFILTIFLLSFLNARSQKIYYDSINKQKFALVQVYKTYERVIAKGYSSVEMYEYLGNYYYETKDYNKSKHYFDLLFKKYKLSQISLKSKEIYGTL